MLLVHTGSLRNRRSMRQNEHKEHICFLLSLRLTSCFESNSSNRYALNRFSATVRARSAIQPGVHVVGDRGWRWLQAAKSCTQYVGGER